MIQEKANTDKIKKEGIVIESLPNASFKVRLEDGSEVSAYISGKIRIHRIKILPGDKVVMEMSSYNDKQGRIVYREK